MGRWVGEERSHGYQQTQCRAQHQGCAVPLKILLSATYSCWAHFEQVVCGLPVLGPRQLAAQSTKQACRPKRKAGQASGRRGVGSRLLQGRPASLLAVVHAMRCLGHAWLQCCVGRARLQRTCGAAGVLQHGSCSLHILLAALLVLRYHGASKTTGKHGLTQSNPGLRECGQPAAEGPRGGMLPRCEEAASAALLRCERTPRAPPA